MCCFNYCSTMSSCVGDALCCGNKLRQRDYHCISTVLAFILAITAAILAGLILGNVLTLTSFSALSTVSVGVGLIGVSLALLSLTASCYKARSKIKVKPYHLV